MTPEEIYNDVHFNYTGDENCVLEAMRRYAKQEVNNALQAASEKVEISLKTDDGISGYYIKESNYFNNRALKNAISAEINKGSILNAYKVE